MSKPETALYVGQVSHKRLRPRSHKLSYRVFASFLDCEKLPQTLSGLRLFSYNSFNLFSLHDSDHGDGSALGDYVRKVAERAGYGDDVAKFYILSYPRILGYSFNPLTTYYGVDKDGQIVLLVYEVNNTFGQRHTYVLPAKGAEGEVVAQSCDKELYVSPFNTDRGTYSFRVTPPLEEMTLGIALRDQSGPLLRANFRGKRQPLTDRKLLLALGRTGWMTLKVTVAIHYEAAILWLKGLRLVDRPDHPTHQTTYVQEQKAKG